ncbi:MAG: heme exporter protein CcmB [Acidimicrobiales bacterium]
MWRDAWTIAAKDLAIERRSRVSTNQVLPFAVVVLMLLGFAIGPRHGLLTTMAPGVFWVAVLLATVLAVQRSFAVEAGDGAADGLRMSGVDPSAVFAGKAIAIAAELGLLEIVLAAGLFVLYGTAPRSVLLLGATAAVATAGLAAAGTTYGVLASNLRMRETLLPLLLLPVLAPVLIASTKAWAGALSGQVATVGPWVRLLAVFAVVYLTIGALAFGPLQELT